MNNLPATLGPYHPQKAEDRFVKVIAEEYLNIRSTIYFKSLVFMLHSRPSPERCVGKTWRSSSAISGSAS